MMIRALTVSLLFAVLAAPAYAQDSGENPVPQDNPQTRQTDQSEDDYRRSQRRRDTGDIFEDIDINTDSSGSGGTAVGRNVKAIDRLDQESRRHLNKQRAKALAEAKPGEPIDAAYEPSEAAKADEYIAKQEQEAWSEMINEANSGLSGIQGQGLGGGQGNQQGQSGQGQAGGGQGGQGQGGQGQGGGQGGQDGQGQGQSGNSPLRGGSASSAAAILDQLKGRTGASGGLPGQGRGGQGQGQQGQGQQGSGGSGQAPQGQSQQGQGQQGQSPQGQSQTPGQQGQGQQGQQGQGQQGQAPQGQSQTPGQQGQGQQGQQGQDGQERQASDSTIRGGSSSSASAILDQLRGGGQQGQNQQGQAPQGQAPQGQSQDQGQAQTQNVSLNQGEAQAQAQAQAAAAKAAAQAQAIADARAASGASADNAAAESAAHHDEPMSPLERLKRDPIDRPDTGGRTSASDFLNRGN